MIIFQSTCSNILGYYAWSCISSLYMLTYTLLLLEVQVIVVWSLSADDRLRCFNAAPDMIKLKGRCYPNIYDVIPGSLRIATNFAMTLRYLSIAFIYVGQNTNKNSFRWIYFGSYFFKTIVCIRTLSQNNSFKKNNIICEW